MLKMITRYSVHILLFFICMVLACLILSSCKNDYASYSHRHYEPDYSRISLRPTTDTLQLPLDDSTSGDSRVYNTFYEDENLLFSFFDERSYVINIFDLDQRVLVKKIDLKNIIKGKKIRQSYVHVLNYDSIFLVTHYELYMIDSNKNIKLTIPFVKEPLRAKAFIESTNPLIFKNNHVYLSLKSFVEAKSFKALNEWRIMYDFDLNKKSAKVILPYPELYRKNLFGYHFIEYSFCYNNKGNFVFSFGADTAIYESDLEQQYYSYFARSYRQKKEILPVPEDTLLKPKATWNVYRRSDAYGALYFDAHNKRYLRLAKSGRTQEDLDSKSPRKPERFIIMDDEFKIIGESEFPTGISLKNLLMLPGGVIYVRTDFPNENALTYVRLQYQDNKAPYYTQK